MLAIVYANLDGSARNNRIIRYETDVINNSEVAPEIELMLLVFSLKHRIRRSKMSLWIYKYSPQNLVVNRKMPIFAA